MADNVLWVHSIHSDCVLRLIWAFQLFIIVGIGNLAIFLLILECKEQIDICAC